MPNVPRVKSRVDKGVQSILIPTDRYTLSQSKKWVKDYKFLASKVDVTGQYYRFRQFNPLSSKKYRNKTIGDGIIFILEF